MCRVHRGHDALNHADLHVVLAEFVLPGYQFTAVVDAEQQGQRAAGARREAHQQRIARAVVVRSGRGQISGFHLEPQSRDIRILRGTDSVFEE